jgi:dTDP-4-amino-4,6-dideoxygalactose transaminase
LNNIDFINKKVSVEKEPKCILKIPPDYLCRLRPLQARIGLLGLPRFESDNFARIAFAKKYHEGLKDIDELIIPPLNEDHSHVYYYFPIQYKNRHELVHYMMKNNCDVAIQHIKNCAELECFKEFYRDCPNASATVNETILLPTYPRYSFDDVERNVMAIRSYFKIS